MTDQYPRRYEDVRGWGTAEGVSITDAGQRFAQYLILVGISQHPYFNQNLVFKGGNALEFVYEPNRSTTDLDFSFIEISSDLPTLIDSIKTQLNASLQYASAQHATVMRIQSVRQNPPRPDAQFPTITSRIAYAFPDQPLQQQRLLAGESGANIISVEMSVNETVCAWREVSITGARHALRVATLEDIVAENSEPSSSRRSEIDTVSRMCSILRFSSLSTTPQSMRRKYLTFSSESAQPRISL